MSKEKIHALHAGAMLFEPCRLFPRESGCNAVQGEARQRNFDVCICSWAEVLGGRVRMVYCTSSLALLVIVCTCVRINTQLLTIGSWCFVGYFFFLLFVLHRRRRRIVHPRKQIFGICTRSRQTIMAEERRVCMPRKSPKFSAEVTVKTYSIY